MAGVRGTGGRPRGRGDRPVSRLRRASESRGAGRVEGVTCGKLARGRREDETGQKTNLQSDRTAPREVKRARAAHRPRERGAGRCGGQPVLGTRRPAWGGHEA